MKMETPQEKLKSGLSILQDFLFKQGFMISEEKYESTLHRDADFWAISKFRKDDKVIEFCFKYWLYNIIYECKNKRVDHYTYFHLINKPRENKFPGYQNDNFLISFENALADFSYLEKDFFSGEHMPCFNSFSQSELDNLSGRLNIERIRGDFKW